MSDEGNKEKQEKQPEAGKKVDEEWKKQAQQEKSKLAEEAADESKQPLPPVSFAVFINSLAAQALIALGAVENPITKKREVNLDQAKYTIDIISILEEKTKGNLTDQEKKLLDQILYDVRMRYVSAVGA